MSHNARIILISLFLLLAGGASASAQEQWDAVLDRYESLNRQCLDLRAKVTAGEAVSDRALASLIKELADIRNDLQRGIGSMNAAQKKRFQTIKDSYAEATGQKKSQPSAIKSPQPAKKAVRAVAQKVEEVAAAPLPPKRMEPVTPIDASRIPTGLVFSSLTADTSLDRNLLPWANAILNMTLQQPAQESSAPVHFGVLGSAGVGQCLSYGILATVSGNHFGGYIAARSSFSSVKYAYTCTSGGRIGKTGRFWGNGVSSVSAASVTAGPLWRATSWLSLYAGAGWRNAGVYWQDIESRWALVEDLSYSGLAVEAGVIVTYKKLSLGCSYSAQAPVFSVGVSF